MSADAIARISAAQKARWAKIKRATGSTGEKRQGRRSMSPAAKARLSKIAKARWKNAKAQGKNAL
jgi:hypothetical protein